MAETFILIPGRTSRQGCGISEGKFKQDYQEETHTLQVAAEDMKRLGLEQGERVGLRKTKPARLRSRSLRPRATSYPPECSSSPTAISPAA